VRPGAVASMLGQTDVFGALGGDALEALARRAVERFFKKGQIIFHEGDPGDALYVVEEGLVKVFVTSEEGDEMVLVTLRPGEVFGELAVLDGGPRSASAEAIEKAKLIVLHRTVLFEILHDHRDITEALLRSIGSLLRRVTEQAADLVFLDLHGRVAKLLLMLADRHGIDSGGDTVLDLGVTQSDLAAMVGGSRQSVNQILHHFERRGYVELAGRTVRIKDRARLERRAS
jgi:CRP/FNR family cyclic AMP-dependent transcriptional regulator